MTSHGLAIGKASLSVALMRGDPRAVPKTEITKLHSLLDGMLERCSAANIQRCKEWVLEYIGVSSARVAALGKYLVALSASSLPQPDADPDGKTRRPRQLHVLYLVNDWLHHVRFHLQDEVAFSTIASAIQPYLEPLFVHSAAPDANAFGRHHSRTGDLLDLWSARRLFPEESLIELRKQASGSIGKESLDRSTRPADKWTPKGILTKPTEVPYHLPAVHGDPSVAYYDLPAATLMPHIIPNVVMPLNPRQIRPLECAPGPPDDKLVQALQDFMRDVDHIYDAHFEGDEADFNIDDFGQMILSGQDTDVRNDEGYYGWSRGFCERMMRRRQDPERHEAEDRSVSPLPRTVRSYSDERSRSRSPPSLDGGESRGRYRSRSRSGSPPPPPRSPGDGNGRFASRSHERAYGQGRDRSRPRSYSPPPPAHVPQSHPLQPHPPNGPPPPPAIPLSFVHGSLPIPPRPPHFTGPWPPPPPPPPPFHGPAGLPFPLAGFSGAPRGHPPPPAGARAFDDLSGRPNE